MLVILMIGCGGGGNDDDDDVFKPSDRSNLPKLMINDMTLPEGCQSVQMSVKATQGNVHNLETVSLQRNKPVAISAGDSFGPVLNFSQPVNLRLEVTDVQGGCNAFNVGKAWDFQGVPIRQGKDLYAVSFQQFVADPRGGVLTLKDVPIPGECQSVKMRLRITQSDSVVELVPLPLQAETSLTQFKAAVDPRVAGEALKKLLGLPPNIAIEIGGIGHFDVSVENREFNFGTFKISGTFIVKGRIQNGIGEFDFGSTFNFHEPLQIRIEITDSQGECDAFRRGQSWEFAGVPTDDGDDEYSVQFAQFDEVQ